MAAGKQKLTHPLRESGWNQEIFATTYSLYNFTSSPPPLCSIKETSIQTWARRFFGTRVHPLLCLLTFPIKSLFLPQHLISRFIGLCAASSTSMDLVTFTQFPPEAASCKTLARYHSRMPTLVPSRLTTFQAHKVPPAALLQPHPLPHYPHTPLNPWQPINCSPHL